MRGVRRQPEPAVHRLFPPRRGRRRKIRVGEASDRNSIGGWIAVALPENAAAAIRTEMETDLEPAIGGPAIDLVIARDAHLVLLPAAAVVKNRAGAALACFAVADIN